MNGRLCGLVALFLLSITAVAAVAEEVPEIPLLPQPPGVDGTLALDEWTKGLPVTQFTQFMPKEGEVPAPLRTEAWVGRTESALCFAFRCYHDQMPQLVTATTEHDGSVWTDDEVEVFIDVQKTAFSYYHLIVNAAGVVYDAWNDGPGQGVVEWDSGAQVATQTFPDGYALGILVPLNTMNPGLNTSGQVTLNLGRVVRYNRTQQTSFGQFHNPSSWKAFSLSGLGPQLWPAATKLLKFGAAAGANEATGEIRNLTDQAVNLTGEAVIEQGGKRETKPLSLQLEPKGKAVVKVAYTLADKMPARLHFVWRNADGREVLAVFRTLKPRPAGPVFVLPTE